MKNIQTHKSDLSPARCRLVEFMQHLNFGRIEGLVIQGAQPVMDRLRAIHEIKFGAENGARREAKQADFALKAQVIELFGHFDQLGDASIQSLVVKHGLPFSMEVEKGRPSNCTNNRN